MRRHRIGGAALVLLLSGAGCELEELTSGSWPAPGCPVVMGPPTLAYTRDLGRSLVVSHTTVGASAFEYTGSIVMVRSERGSLWSTHMIGAGTDVQPGFWRSDDSGCTWRLVAASTQAFAGKLVAPTHGETVGGFSSAGDPTVFTVTEAGTVSILPVDHRVIALTVVSSAPLRWRWIDATGGIWEAQGASLHDVRRRPGRVPTATVVAAAFDPHAADALVIGDTQGAWRTRDGGIDWEPVLVEGADTAAVSVHALASANSGEYWMLGRSITAGEAVDRYYRSSDGGASFHAVLEEGPGRGFTPPTPQPNRRGVLFWIDPVSANGRAALHRLDAVSGQETSEAIASPLDPVVLALPPDGSDIVYLGLSQPVDDDLSALAPGQ